jgi:hypothetical protein
MREESEPFERYAGWRRGKRRKGASIGAPVAAG